MSVLGVSLSPAHNFSKDPVPSITLIAGIGVQGDSHAGTTIQHVCRKHIQPPPPNLRQVHLIQSEILSEASSGDKPLQPGELGENITTAGINLLALGKGTKLRFVDEGKESGDADVPVVTVTGLRNPCFLIDKHRAGLREKFITRNADRKIVERKAGIMSVVEVGGEVKPGMKIVVEKPAVHEELECV